MMRNLKVLGLALAAMFAMSAVVASAASAQAVLTTEGGGNVTLTGEQEGTNVLVRGARNVTCVEGHLAGIGEVATNATEATLEPTYKNCDTNLGGPATVTNTGCSYKLKISADAGTPEDTWTATAGLHCNEGKHILVQAYLNASAHSSGSVSCAYTFTDWTGGKGTQHNQNLGTIDITNKAANPPVTPKNYLQVHLNVGGVVSTRVVGSALLCGPEVHTTGELTGTGYIKGKQGANDVGITLSTKS